MSQDILVVAEHLDGKIADISFEMTGKARELAAALGGRVSVLLLGSGMEAQAAGFAADATLYLDDPRLAHYNPQAYQRVIAAVVAERAPRLVMLGYSSVGMDVAAWLSVKSERPCIAYVNQLAVENGAIVARSQLYGGKLTAESAPQGKNLIVTIMAGAFAAEAGRGAAPVQAIAAPIALDGLRTRFVELIKPEAGDVDITAEEKLVAVGRGVGGAEGVELAGELAEALGAVVAASRPVTDAGWLPKSRQVGKSGLTVRPKLYLMLGISGAPEHLEGMKDADLIIAVNSDANAPIFNVAHYGATQDLFEVAEAMLAAL
ncbi:MAG: electron transfer flavoprotein subunit alpha/FixB family protein [Caldilineales bacterium]|nr:electron transfer flavoprotein subunit alpha/FixB family protein [Caldilineales bacterium]MCW5856790.1 electron transfer flavoprotein subunit alpha/FixB family protein [Caldilineales bacterium]